MKPGVTPTLRCSSRLRYEVLGPFKGVSCHWQEYLLQLCGPSTGVALPDAISRQYLSNRPPGELVDEMINPALHCVTGEGYQDARGGTLGQRQTKWSAGEKNDLRQRFSLWE